MNADTGHARREVRGTDTPRALSRDEHVDRLGLEAGHPADGHRGGSSEMRPITHGEDGGPQLLVGVEPSVVRQQNAPAQPAPAALIEVAVHLAAAEETDGLARGQHACLFENQPFVVTCVLARRVQRHLSTLPDCRVCC
ncbi:hypothetical protein QLQ12_33785 [Actinoplanes sp. NEAU-A12]|uniref:Uncharacterized protein n=1 Tax=Actinoplanes sandaracinus TaxID=3045177 RepID=A0ABT6WVE9_9ACTN|nr:hypothetical protein [Actinoplanes sandaracinus]MDI6103595.1 hypothetical protein [Actinoplanes sandaracinus]